MSTDTFPPWSPLSKDLSARELPETASDPVWTAWLARGIAHSRVVERRFNRLAIALCAALVAVVVFYTWFGW